MSGISRGISSKGISAGIFGVFAVSLTFGAVQFASGRDLIQVVRGSSSATAVTVNRAAKADRMVASATGPVVRTRTISIRLESLPNTSILIRIPLVKEADNQTRSGSAAGSLMKSGDRKATVACEPSVSILTEVAKRLQPGRCIT
jgi:hypothetical protein